MSQTSSDNKSDPIDDIQTDDADTPSRKCSLGKICFICNCDGNEEVKAWSFASIAQGAILIGPIFISTAILLLAEQAAGCDIESEEVCENTLGVVRPGSLLTLIASISGFVSSLIMPIVGAIVDHTPFRRQVAFGTAIGVVIINALQISIGENTWSFCLSLQTLQPIVFLAHFVVLYAYLHELTRDEEKLTRYNASFAVIRLLTMLVFIPFVIGISSVFPGIGERGTLQFDVGTARISQVVIATSAALAFIPTFYHGLKDRPALSKIPEGSNLLTTGFRKLYHTSRDIIKSCPAIKWFLLASGLYGSVTTASGVIAVSYMTDFLKMNASENGIAMFLFLMGGIIGAALLPSVAKKFCLLGALKLSLVLFVVMFVVTGVTIKGPEDKRLFYVYSTVWGVVSGWVTPNSRTLYLTIIPTGQESELMGIFIFFSNGFVWVPPLLITLLTANGVSWRINFAVLAVFPLLGLVVLYLMGSYEGAKNHAAEINRSRNAGADVESSAKSVECVKMESANMDEEHTLK